MNAASKLQHQTIESKTIFTLPDDVLTQAVARACRSALLTFSNGALKWGKMELACWLAGPYASVTSNAETLVQWVPRRAPSRLATVDTTHLQDVMRAAVSQARDLLRASTFPEGGALSAWDAWRRGLVVRCEDSTGNEGWLPLDLPDMRLGDRILSLWAADYLTNGEEYESLLGVCGVCEIATFDPFLRVTERCSLHSAHRIAVEWGNGEASSVYSSISDAPRSSRRVGVPSVAPVNTPSEPLSGIHRKIPR